MGDIVLQQKKDGLTSMQAAATAMISLRSQLAAATQNYFSKKFNPSATNEIILADLVGTIWEGLSIAQITAVITTFQAFETFIDAGHDDNLAAITQ